MINNSNNVPNGKAQNSNPVINAKRTQTIGNSSIKPSESNPLRSVIAPKAVRIRVTDSNELINRGGKKIND